VRLFGELDAAGLEFFVRGLAVLGGEEDGPGETLRGEVGLRIVENAFRLSVGAN